MRKKFSQILQEFFGIQTKTQTGKVKNNIEFNWNYVTEHENEEIEKYSDFLKDCGTNYEQKRAVVSDFNRILVLAGAGSGKTKVLTKRIVYQVKNKKIPLHNILAVTFTREARKEMVKRISKTLDKKEEDVNRNVRTFHSFALSILKQNEDFDVISESEQRDIISRIINSFQDNEIIMNSLNNYITNNLIDKVKEMDNQNKKEDQVKTKPEEDDFGKENVKTTSGIFVKSKSERDIANYLTLLGLNWEYEKIVTWADKEFKPDFTIENEFYIEHWCYDENTPEFGRINKKKYLEYRRWKENQYQKYNKILISTEENQMKDLQKLQLKLKKNLEILTGKKLPIYKPIDLYNISPQFARAFDHLLEEILEIINLAKSRLLSIEDVKERAKKTIQRKSK